MRIRYQGEGDAGRYGGPSGDLYVVISVEPHPFLEREGNDLHYVLPISFPQATLGTEIMIPTLEGETKLKVPEGTQSGTEFRLRNKGVPYLNDHGRGDLIVQVVAQVPRKLTKPQKELMRQLCRDSYRRKHAIFAQLPRQDEGYFQLISEGACCGLHRCRESGGFDRYSFHHAPIKLAAAIAAVSVRKIFLPQAYRLPSVLNEARNLRRSPSPFRSNRRINFLR